MMVLKEALFENVEIPEELGPLDVTVDDHKVKAFAFTQDDYLPWYFDQSPFGRRIGHASVLANDLLNVYYTKYDRHSVVGLHAEEELTFHSPVFVDETVRITGRYVEKFVRRGKGYVVMKAEARAADGRLLVSHRGVEVMRAQPGEMAGRQTATPSADDLVETGYSPELPLAFDARQVVAAHQGIEPLLKFARQDQMSVFSYVADHQRNIHNDLALAQREGLQAPIAQGQQLACFVAEWLTRFFGSVWFVAGSLRVKFLRPVFAHESIRIAGAIREIDRDRMRLHLWIENEAGQAVSVGWAACRVDAETTYP